MKNIALSVCVIGAALALSACETSGQGHVNSGAPYGLERTAGDQGQPAHAERVFRSTQTK